MNNNEIYKAAFKQFVWFCLWLAAARFSKGASLSLMVILGVVWAFQSKTAKAFGVLAMIAIMVTVNPFILPKSGIAFTLGVRVGPLLICIALALSGITVRQKSGLPMGLMILYLFVAIISSARGWAPLVSYMKLLNFAAFFMGLWLGARRLSLGGEPLMELRAVFLALCVFLVVGSIALLPFPSIATLEGLKFSRLDVTEASAAFYQNMGYIVEQGEGSLLCGVTYHSQALGALVTSALAWVICDLLFVEKRARFPHILLIVCSIFVLYKTRSRVALLGLMVTSAMVYFYLAKKVNLHPVARRRMGSFLAMAAVLICIIAVIAEVRNNSISRWVRKTNNADSDNRSIGEAVTASRQGLIEMCMDDFKRNPLFGMGFQVAYYTPIFLQNSKGMVFSSPIEKGVWPVMVLGETGVVGEVVFISFLLYFWIVGERRRLFITITLMAVFLSTNMGEATLFSPGGPGGLEWLFCLIGGYTLDICSKTQTQLPWWRGGYFSRQEGVCLCVS